MRRDLYMSAGAELLLNVLLMPFYNFIIKNKVLWCLLRHIFKRGTLMQWKTNINYYKKGTFSLKDGLRSSVVVLVGEFLSSFVCFQFSFSTWILLSCWFSSFQDSKDHQYPFMPQEGLQKPFWRSLSNHLTHFAIPAREGCLQRWNGDKRCTVNPECTLASNLSKERKGCFNLFVTLILIECTCHVNCLHPNISWPPFHSRKHRQQSSSYTTKTHKTSDVLTKQ